VSSILYRATLFLCFQTFFEVAKVDASPDGTDATTGNKNVLFTQLINGPMLTMSRERDSIINNSLLSRLISKVLEVSATATIYQRIHTAFIGSFSITIKYIPLDLRALIGFEYVAMFFSQID